jgi:hypothetical protein
MYVKNELDKTQQEAAVAWLEIISDNYAHTPTKTTSE